MAPSSTKNFELLASDIKPAFKNITITFQVHFSTSFGQNIFITGNHALLGNNDWDKALPMQYYDTNLWAVTIDIAAFDEPITYNYLLKNADGSAVQDWGTDKVLSPTICTEQELVVIDAWNHAGYYENVFYTEPFKKVLLPNNSSHNANDLTRKYTHTFKVKVPLLNSNETLCILGNTTVLGNWQTIEPVLLTKAKDAIFYTTQIDFGDAIFPIAYKYGVYDKVKQAFVKYEDGNNRMLYETPSAQKQIMVNDGFAVLPNNTYKAAGTAIPVFSLRSNNSLGVGEFADLNLLVDWCKKVGLKMIQILPINDTVATHTWQDSYPYAAISAFALHPLYMNVEQMIGEENSPLLESIEDKKVYLNSLPQVDYEAVMIAKMNIIKQVYFLQKKKTFATKAYKQFFAENKHWLVPYACFCYLRDEYGTPDCSKWPQYNQFDEKAISKLSATKSPVYDAVALHYFIQYHLHVQLKSAAEYAHKNGIIVKGDIAIGVYRYGADAWQQPHLFNMQLQAGAPPDDFAIKGQNWGFPTYNWQQMKQDGYAWWKQRFEQMSHYFDAFRIDHILGFFRIWSIPLHAVEGILGYFVPAIPVHVNEFANKGIWFDNDRYTKPFITTEVLQQLCGEDAVYVQEHFLQKDDAVHFSLKANFDTQRKVEQYFAEQMPTDFNQKIQQCLYNLISNVILLAVGGSNGTQFHFRFNIHTTASFQMLEYGTQKGLESLYVDYFFRRQDDFWRKEALQKLPALKRVTNMMVCGEDLGLVPACVPEIMEQLGLLTLEIQRMPKAAGKQFFNPKDAPYLSVVTPSTHDMSTIRGWWQEDAQRTQQFYSYELGIAEAAPPACSAYINTAIVQQHLYSPAMWSIFQLQDILGMDENIRLANPDDERINVPANPKHYWRYRMHITLEDLLQQTKFNETIRKEIEQSGRGI